MGRAVLARVEGWCLETKTWTRPSLPLLSMEHGTMQTLPVYLGQARAHIATLEDLIYLESLDAEAEESLIAT